MAFLQCSRKQLSNLDFDLLASLVSGGQGIELDFLAARLRRSNGFVDVVLAWSFGSFLGRSIRSFTYSECLRV